MTDYPARMTLRPIERWPGKLTSNRVSSQFSAPWRATLDLLDRELWHLGPAGRNAPAVLQIAMREQDFRLDGMPRANARPEHPGVILAIESTKGPLSFPCDRFVTWQDNLRAIALSLEALRKIDRYGITPNAEQYTGWKQLPTGGASSAPSTADSEMVVLSYADLPIGEVVSLDQAYRRARANVHPDRRAGDRTDWDRVEAAADVLRAAGKLT
ncbi:DnaJ-like chaperonin [Gordonia phage Maridalia]|uniref:DnaJ-like chaperonin n=2 Tax=Nymphadoravirus TaxID=2169636 RepID=A0A7G8LLJ0_9CAUD|nr:DnaJ-like chaperonin [Gordonia phage Bunnybear]YP_010653174.1 DnaJ-like chaperonin [Gordonia phage Maridalia]AZF98803.1 DnaJ-like chaperonin [Gordonia phage Maridalia]QNJ58112.1 DnaJ-like chaperonin [Gordonia phage Bunnybear]